MDYKIGDDVYFYDGDVKKHGTVVNIEGIFAKVRVRSAVYKNPVFKVILLSNLVLENKEQESKPTKLEEMIDRQAKQDAKERHFKDLRGGTAKDATHYQKAAMQPIEIMQRFLTREEFIGFLKGNIIKYKARAAFKGSKKEDMQKTRQYAYWLAMAEAGVSIDAKRDSVPNDFHMKTTFDISHNYSDRQLIMGGKYDGNE